ncbi:MAG: MATE family efflux transporter [Lachnospiraceae bacterium]|nr:MATE family efflux transporter [Lachnospiraceae bacterium]
MAEVDVRKMSLFKLGWPIFVQCLLSLCLGYIDMLMITGYDENAVSGIGQANQILGFLTLAFTIISSAAGVMIAQYIGAKLEDKLNEIYTVSIFFNLILSGVISFILLAGCDFILKIMQTPGFMLTDSKDYMMIVGGFMFVQAIIDVFSQIFRNNGKTKFGMLIVLSMNIINIVGNYIFLFGPLKHLNLGVKGVALSTTISRVIALVIAILLFKYKIEGSISIKCLWPFPKEILKKLLKLGIPTAGENISYNIAQIIILIMVNTFDSDVVSNTKTFAQMVSNFAYLYSVSAAVATSIIVGHAVGANEYDYAYSRVMKSLKKALLISVGIAIINWMVSPITIGFFTKNSEIIKLSSKVLFICIFLEIGRTANLVIINSMRAAGDVKFPTYLGMASMWGVAVLFGYIFAIVLNMGLAGIWIAMAMDEILRGIVVYIRWKKGGWRNKRVIEE